MKKQMFGTTAIFGSLVILLAWTYLQRETKSSIADRGPYRGIEISAQDVFRYASWTDKGIAGGALEEVSLRFPKETGDGLEMTLAVRSGEHVVSREYVFYDMQFIREEDGLVRFSVKQKQEMRLARTD